MYLLPSSMDDHRGFENCIWLICFSCAAVVIILLSHCSKLKTEDKKINEFLDLFNLCALLFVVVFFLLGITNILYLQKRDGNAEREISVFEQYESSASAED